MSDHEPSPTEAFPTYPDLKGKVVVVTGASRGIGAATCHAFSANGARVAACGRDPVAIEATVVAANRAQGEAAPFVCDCRVPAEMRRLRREIESCLGVPDVVVAFAGGFRERTPLLEITDDEWEQVLDANLKSTFLTIREFAPGMTARGTGVFITMASNAARQLDVPLTASYAAAKAGVVQLSRHAALELGPSGVRINCVAPATTLTDRVAAAWGEANLGALARRSPLRRLGAPEDTAAATLFLASEAAGWITGVTLDITGGRVMA